MGFSVSRQPHFKAQAANQVVIWVYGLFTNTKGNYINKTMQECTGSEITQEWLYHMGATNDEIKTLAKSINAIPCMMPYITSFFQPRNGTDRPKVIVDGATNFAFIGQ
jgi:oleate hydratase